MDFFWDDCPAEEFDLEEDENQDVDECDLP